MGMITVEYAGVTLQFDDCTSLLFCYIRLTGLSMGQHVSPLSDHPGRSEAAVFLGSFHFRHPWKTDVGQGIRSHYSGFSCNEQAGLFSFETIVWIKSISGNVFFEFIPLNEDDLNIKEKGVEKLYLHLDGWAEPGYDNQHPDYLPAWQAAGGWQGSKELSGTIQECGYLFGLHDQYQDYYFDAPSFDPDFACQAPDGSIFEMSRWAGGRQSYLCASQAPLYVKRNFEEVLGHGIQLGASYLDAFTCNEGDECANPWHRMTRQECFAYRSACFDYLWSKGILPSSEEASDWAMRSLVFTHYGPYDFMLQPPGTPRRGIPVPLFNLVYHDCLILPWLMDKIDGQEAYMLYALLNGGAAYMDKDGAYSGCDGAFDSAAAELHLDEEIARYRIVAQLQERVPKCEMVRHEFLCGDWKQQRTTFSDGTVVTVDLGSGHYAIDPPCTP